MSKLDAAERRALPASAFAVKGGHYPIEDRGHAKAALARVSEFGSPEEKSEVRAKVRARYPGMGKPGKMSPAFFGR